MTAHVSARNTAGHLDAISPSVGEESSMSSAHAIRQVQFPMENRNGFQIVFNLLTLLRRHVIDPLPARLLLCVLLACILFVGVPISIAILVAAVSPASAPDALGLPL